MKYFFACVATLTAAALITAQTAAPPVQAPHSAEFDAIAGLVTAKMADYHIPGVALGVWQSGKTTTQGFGITNTEDPLPVTADTIFPLASISKTVTATAMMRLVDEGRVDLHAPVRRYL